MHEMAESQRRYDDCPIRVLNVVGRMDRGGVETMIMNIYRNIDRTKVQFDFLEHYGKKADYYDEIVSLGGRVYQMPCIKTVNKTYYWKILKYAKALHSFFSEHREYNIIHGHMTNTAAIYIPIAKKYGSKYCIAHSHSTKSKRGIAGILTSILQFPLKRLADDWFACSMAAAKWIYSNDDIASGRVRILNNAVDTTTFQFKQDNRVCTRDKLMIRDQFVLGHVGSFFHHKNHGYLVDVFAEVVKIHPESVLMLIGDGILRGEIEAKVKKLNLAEKVIFLGTRSDIADLMMAMDLFILPSKFEGLPVVCIEAQASGLPCVVSTEVTKEADITGLVNYLPLQLGVAKWASTILSTNGQKKREQYREIVLAAGYDVKTSAVEMQQYYIAKQLFN